MAAAGKLDRRVVRTRKAITEAFERLVVEHGVEKLTVSAIAREADIDRKTFYLHYNSVNDLANRRVEASIEQIVQTLEQRGAGKSPIERVRIVLGEVNRIFTEHLDVYENIASALSIDQMLSYFTEAMEATLEHFSSDLPRASAEDAHMRLQFYIAGALSLYSSWLKSDHSTPIESVSDTIELAIQAPVFPTMASSA